MDGSASSKDTIISIILEERKQDMGLVLVFGMSFLTVGIKRIKRENDYI